MFNKRLKLENKNCLLKNTSVWVFFCLQKFLSIYMTIFWLTCKNTHTHTVSLNVTFLFFFILWPYLITSIAHLATNVPNRPTWSTSGKWSSELVVNIKKETFQLTVLAFQKRKKSLRFTLFRNVTMDIFSILQKISIDTSSFYKRNRM